MAITGAKLSMSPLSRIAAQLLHLSTTMPVSNSMHLQYAAGTGGKTAADRKLVTQCLGTAAQLARGMSTYIELASGTPLSLADVFAALARHCAKLS
jgi:hypothetical protein